MPSSGLPTLEPGFEQALPERLAHLAREVENLKDSLEHAQRLAALGTIASIIAHEFNNILTPVMSYAQMALSSPHDRPLLLKAVQKAYKGSDRASQIAGAILGFARSEFGSLHGEPGSQPRQDDHHDRVEVAAAVQGALSCLAREPSKDGIKLVLDVPDNLAVSMRPIALQQVLLNLILNARRAMANSRSGATLKVAASVIAAKPQAPRDAVVAEESSTWNNRSGGVVRPEVERAATSVGTEWVTISITDSGHGLSPDQLRRVFCAFVTGQSQQGGTGLGLTVCQRLTQDAGGMMWCRSQVDSGAEFTICLPRAS